ncbi:MAG: FprA family A-type flavoprotein [Alphaproteobacteria bacterium]|nr:FprA family A-type flavoprotein [Alphaproteobacteria bacterium]
MQAIQQISPDLFYVGASEGRHPLFENIYPIPHGMSYNSYLFTDEKTALLDTCDSAVREQFLENITGVLAGRDLDYVVVHHMEPDHAALLDEILNRYPAAKIVCNAKTSQMITQFFHRDLSARTHLVKEGDTLSLGHHTLSFYMAPMVHWPEVMVSYDTTDKILFSADAFGTFGELNGTLFADNIPFADFLPEARRYYTNIVGKYGNQVQMLLKKAASLDIQQIFPLHGPLWRTNLNSLIDKYQQWSTYTPEEKGTLIIYGSIYGHTEAAARILANKLAVKGITSEVYDASKTDSSYLLAKAFQYSHIVLASVTYNNGIFPPIETFLLDMRAHMLQNRTVHLIQNGSWAPTSGKLMSVLLADMKGITLDDQIITITSALKPDQDFDLESLATRISES